MKKPFLAITLCLTVLLGNVPQATFAQVIQQHSQTKAILQEDAVIPADPDGAGDSGKGSGGTCNSADYQVMAATMYNESYPNLLLETAMPLPSWVHHNQAFSCHVICILEAPGDVPGIYAHVLCHSDVQWPDLEPSFWTSGPEQETAWHSLESCENNSFAVITPVCEISGNPG